MKKRIVLFVTLALMLALCAGAMAAGVTLRIYTPFADLDTAAQPFSDLLTDWEQETGNIAEDHSGVLYDVWMDAMQEALRAGEADLLVLPVGSGVSYEDVLTAEELAQLAPELPIRAFPAMAEADGSVLLAPVRLGWQALYVNRALLESLSLDVPEDFETLVYTCALLTEADLLPIANSLSDWAEILLNCAALSAAPAASFGSEESLSGAQSTLVALSLVGAFGPYGASDDEAMLDRFMSGNAAMRADDYQLAEMLSQEMAENVVVIPFPRQMGDEDEGVLAGTPLFGVAMSRACAEDDDRREAALSLLAEMMTGESAGKLVTAAEGALGESILSLTAGATDCAGELFDRIPDDFDAWMNETLTLTQNL